MSSLFNTLLQSTAVRIALGLVVLIAIGSGTYYLIESRPPMLAYAASTTGTVTQEVSGSGIVAPIQNPTLTFTSGGRITYLNAKVGQKVAAGTLLASVDTGVLQAQLAAAQANVNKLTAGPRAVDLAGRQTAVSQASQSAQANLLSLQNAVVSAKAQAQEAVYTKADPLFTGIATANGFAPNPKLAVINSIDASQNTAIDAKIAAEQERLSLISTFSVWNTETTNVTGSGQTQAGTIAAAQTSLTHLYEVRTFFDTLVTALSNASPSQTYSQAQISAALAQVNSGRDTVNAQIAILTSGISQVSTQNLSVQSAQDQLNVTLAGSTSQDISAAQAQVAAIAAQIRQLEIVAPFSGTIASVNVKAGDVISPNTDAISLLPNGTSEVDVYLTELEIAQLATGDRADVTLDAYGASRVFSATIATIDRAPSKPEGAAENQASGYKVTLIFTEADPSIAIGMHANVTIHGATKNNVVLVPKSAIIIDGTQTYVLVAQVTHGSTPVRTKVTVGLIGKEQAEIASGITTGAKVVTVGTAAGSTSNSN